MSLAVCVFCSSADGLARPLRDLASEVGAGLAERGWRLVYGGGGLGLMGEVARAALAGGAHVTGVIPHGLAALEAELLEVDELVRVDDLRARKAAMDARADAFLVLPGGLGTLEELLETLTLRQLGVHDRPIVLLDPDGHWRALHDLLAGLVASGFAPADLAGALPTAGGAAQALDALAAHARPQR
ncbi:MAG: TIGR00730 family Rossman fold protein [Egibacteraceae bacterium]